jgi:hypothetical protein
MTTPLATLVAAILSASTPNRTVELSDPRILASSAGISSVYADGDTAYVVIGGSLKKLVYGEQIRVVDSTATIFSDNPTKYVELADGYGILFTPGPYFNGIDTSFRLIDWRKSDPSSKWVGWASLKQFLGTQGGGFGGESNIDGIATGDNQAIFAGDHGLVKLVVGSRGSADSGKITIVGALPGTNDFSFSGISLSRTDFAGLTSYHGAFYHSSDPQEELALPKLVDSSWKRPDAMDSATSFRYGLNLVADSGKCWLYLGYNGRQALHNCIEDGRLRQDTIQVPSILKGVKFYSGSNRTAMVRRSSNGLAVLAGDSLLDFYDWDGLRLPVPAGTLALRVGTQDLDFGDTTFWHVSGTELRAFRLSIVEDPDRPANPSGTFDGSVLSASWTTVSGKTSYVVQVNVNGKDTTVFVSASQISIELSDTMKTASATADGIWWRVADAEQLDATASSAAINALEYTAWQKTSTNPSSIARSMHHAGFEAKSSLRGVVVTWTATNSGSVEIFDGSGRRLGRVESTLGATEFVTSAKGLLVVRGAGQVAKLTRF